MAITNRTNLLETVEKLLVDPLFPYKSIVRVFATGHVEVIGGFKHIPPITNFPGWVIRIIAKSQKRYYIAIVARKFKYRIVVLNKIPWKYWDGDKSDNYLYAGDRPHYYKRLKRRDK